jgi:hypothetical protein
VDEVGDADVVTLGDVVDRHEAVEQCIRVFST